MVVLRETGWLDGHRRFPGELRLPSCSAPRAAPRPASIAGAPPGPRPANFVSSRPRGRHRGAGSTGHRDRLRLGCSTLPSPTIRPAFARARVPETWPPSATSRSTSSARPPTSIIKSRRKPAGWDPGYLQVILFLAASLTWIRSSGSDDTPLCGVMWRVSSVGGRRHAANIKNKRRLDQMNLEKKLRILTMVVDERDYLAIWLGYWRKFVPDECLHILCHGENRALQELAEGVRFDILPRPDPYPEMEDDRWKMLADTVSALTHDGLTVVYTDVDEIIVADPATRGTKSWTS